MFRSNRRAHPFVVQVPYESQLLPDNLPFPLSTKVPSLFRANDVGSLVAGPRLSLTAFHSSSRSPLKSLFGCEFCVTPRRPEVFPFSPPFIGPHFWNYVDLAIPSWLHTKATLSPSLPLSCFCSFFLFAFFFDTSDIPSSFLLLIYYPIFHPSGNIYFSSPAVALFIGDHGYPSAFPPLAGRRLLRRTKSRVSQSCKSKDLLRLVQRHLVI